MTQVTKAKLLELRRAVDEVETLVNEAHTRKWAVEGAVDEDALAHRIAYDLVLRRYGKVRLAYEDAMSEYCENSPDVSDHIALVKHWQEDCSKRELEAVRLLHDINEVFYAEEGEDNIIMIRAEHKIAHALALFCERNKLQDQAQPANGRENITAA